MHDGTLSQAFTHVWQAVFELDPVPVEAPVRSWQPPVTSCWQTES